MLGFGSKKRKAIRRLIAAVQADGRQTRAHLASQAIFAIDHLGYSSIAVWDDAYSRGYIFGAFEALVMHLPSADRETIAEDVVTSGFVSFAANAFSIGEHEAREGYAAVATRQHVAPLRHAIADGRSDGIQMKLGFPATLWLAHLVEQARSEAPAPGRR